jgi:hypothetical protein
MPVITMVDIAGDCRTGGMRCSVQDIELVLGPANIQDDPITVTHSWGFEVDGVRCGIWDYNRSARYGQWSTYGPQEVLEKLFPGKICR